MAGRGHGWCAFVLVVAAAIGLTSCAPRGDSSVPVPTRTFEASQAAKRLVVVLPGRRDDLSALVRSGVVAAVQESWPDADVVLVELTFDYYIDRVAGERLHDEVIAPARSRGYDEIWLVGASLGGLGALMVDRENPGTVDGIVLLAPYLGEEALLAEITAAGGVASWDPGPARDESGDAWQRGLWRHIKSWSSEPEKARNVWLLYGDDDRLRESLPVLIAVLRGEQVLEREGGHTWRVWVPGLREVLERIAAAR